MLIQGCWVREKRLRRGFPGGGGLPVSPGAGCDAATRFLLGRDLVFPSLPCAASEQSLLVPFSLTISTSVVGWGRGGENLFPKESSMRTR